MLEDCLIESRRSARSKKPFTLVASIATHGSLIAALVLVPLFQEQLLPHAAIFDPLSPPETRSEVIETVPAGGHPEESSPVPPPPSALIAPPVIPTHIAIVDEEPVGVGVVGLPPGRFGTNGGDGLDLANLLPSVGSRVASPPPAPPPPSPPPAPPKPPEPVPTPAPAVPVRKSYGVVMSNLVHQVQPVYPPLARASRTQGVVLLEAVITRDGTIDPARIRVISGHVLLNEAAIDAIKQWRYKPTLLSGEPVEIITTITINFSFN